MKVSELESLQRIEKPTHDQLNRISVLRRKGSKNKPRPVVKRKATPDIALQLDKVHERFIGKIEPWTVMICTKCKTRYHLQDGAECECGKEESDRRKAKHIGGMTIGSKKVS